jgi:hypothetical protein
VTATIQPRKYEPADWREFADTPEEAFARMANRYEAQYWRVEELYAENKRLRAAAAGAAV